MIDLKAFRKAAFVPREQDVTLDAMVEAGMGDGVVTVRGLTAHDLATAEESVSKGKTLSDLVEKLAGSGAEKIAGLMEGLGYQQDVPAALAKRLEHVRLGVVKPEMELSDVVKLAEVFPVEFTILANTIMELTGKGQVAQVKPKPSGGSRTSKQA